MATLLFDWVGLAEYFFRCDWDFFTDFAYHTFYPTSSMVFCTFQPTFSFMVTKPPAFRANCSCLAEWRRYSQKSEKQGAVVIVVQLNINIIVSGKIVVSSHINNGRFRDNDLSHEATSSLSEGVGWHLKNFLNICVSKRSLSFYSL